MIKKTLTLVLFFIVFGTSAYAEIPNSIIIPDKAWQVDHNPELVQFLSKTYKIRWYGVPYSNKIFYFPIITHIPNPSLPSQEEVIDDPNFLEAIYLYYDLTYERPIQWGDYQYLNFDAAYWASKREFWNSEAESWDPNDAVKYATGLYACGIAISIVSIYIGGNIHGLLGLVNVGSTLLSLTTQTLTFIENLAIYPNSEELIKYALNSIANLNNVERENLKESIDYLNYITSKIDQISTGGETINNLLLQPGSVDYASWIEIIGNLKAFNYFGYHSTYGQIALKGTAKIAASQAVLGVGKASIVSLSDECTPLMINLFRNANLHCIVLASLCAKIEEDIIKLKSGTLNNYNEYNLLIVQILKNMQLYNEVRHEFANGTHKLLYELDNSGLLGLCELAVDDDDIDFWDGLSSTFEESVKYVRDEVYELSLEWDYVLSNVYYQKKVKAMPWIPLLLLDGDTVGVSGYWEISNSPAGESGDSGYIQLQQSDGNISGTWLCEDSETITGTIIGTQISFSWTENDGNTVTCTGNANDNTMSGTWSDTSAGSGTWEAMKVSQPNCSHTFQLPDTGQTQSYTDTFGEDSDYTINPPSFTDNEDGTITDNVTGLMWQKKDDINTNWDNAVNHCNNLTLAGYADWRLPSNKEILNIVNFDLHEPAIDTNFFPDITLGYYWSSTSSSQYNYAWTVSFRYGEFNRTSDKSANNEYVKCVRGRQISNNFSENGDGTVTDQNTGLMWHQVQLPLDYWEYNYSTPAINSCENLVIGNYSDWRLPNVKELQSIIDYESSPMLDRNYFPEPLIEYYWTSTTAHDYSPHAWFVSLHRGSVSKGYKNTRYGIMCARGGQ